MFDTLFPSLLFTLAITVESHDYAPAPLCMLALGKSEEGAYTWDPYISIDDHYQLLNAMWAHDLCTFSGQNSRKSTK